MYKYSILLFIGFITLVLMGACSEPEQKQAGQIGQLTVGLTPFIGEAALFVADEKGFFEDYGLDVTLRVNNAGSESVRQLLAGEIDIAHVAETPALFTIMDRDYFTGEKQGEIRILANMIHANRIQKVIARRDAGIESPQDIRGKRVGLAGGTQSEFHLDSFLLEYNIDIEEIDTVHLGVKQQIEEITAGTIDVIVTWEPNAAHSFYLLQNNAVELSTRLTYSTLWLVTTLNHFADDNPKILTAYLRGLRKAQKYILDNPQWTIELLSEKTGTSHEVIDDVISQIDYELSLTERMLKLLNEQQRWMLSKGLDYGKDQSLTDLIDFRFMDEVYPEGITLIR